METETQQYIDPKATAMVGNALAQWLGSYNLRGDRVFLNFDTGTTLYGIIVADPRNPGKKSIMLDFGPVRIGVDQQ